MVNPTKLLGWWSSTRHPSLRETLNRPSGNRLKTNNLRGQGGFQAEDNKTPSKKKPMNPQHTLCTYTTGSEHQKTHI